MNIDKTSGFINTNSIHWYDIHMSFPKVYDKMLKEPADDEDCEYCDLIRFFDRHDIIIEIFLVHDQDFNNKFGYSVWYTNGRYLTIDEFYTRDKAENLAVLKAIQILEGELHETEQE